MLTSGRRKPFSERCIMDPLAWPLDKAWLLYRAVSSSVDVVEVFLKISEISKKRVIDEKFGKWDEGTWDVLIKCAELPARSMQIANEYGLQKLPLSPGGRRGGRTLWNCNPFFSLHVHGTNGIAQKIEVISKIARETNPPSYFNLYFFPVKNCNFNIVVLFHVIFL